MGGWTDANSNKTTVLACVQALAKYFTCANLFNTQKNPMWNTIIIPSVWWRDRLEWGGECKAGLITTLSSSLLPLCLAQSPFFSPNKSLPKGVMLEGNWTVALGTRPGVSGKEVPMFREVSAFQKVTGKTLGLHCPRWPLASRSS